MFTQIVFLLLFFSLFWNFYPIFPHNKKTNTMIPFGVCVLRVFFVLKFPKFIFLWFPPYYHPRAFLSPVVDPENTKLIHSYESTHAKNCRGLIEKRAHTIDDFMRGKARLFSKTNKKKCLSIPNQKLKSQICKQNKQIFVDETANKKQYFSLL